MDKILEKIQKIGIVPVVTLHNTDNAKPLAEALREGGISCVEITFRTEEAEESIRKISQEVPEMLIGAGTILTIDQVDRAVNAGAQFIVSPGFNPKIIHYCLKKKVLIIPGIANPSEIEQAMELGIEVVKIFPAEVLGGITMIKALAAPYTNMKFMPTGGINLENINTYLAFPQVVACGGTWMVNEELLQTRQFDRIRDLCKQAVMKMFGFELKHIGMNCENDEKVIQTAKEIADIFRWEAKENEESVFVGDMIEVMKIPYLEIKNHIAIKTNHIERAMYYLKARGATFDWKTAKYKEKRIYAICMDQKIGEFSIHLVQK